VFSLPWSARTSLMSILVQRIADPVGVADASQDAMKRHPWRHLVRRKEPGFRAPRDGTERMSGTRQSFHLIEHHIEGICSTGPRPVSATCFIASKRSRRAFGIGVVREASSLPRYCNSPLALKPKKSGVH